MTMKMPISMRQATLTVVTARKASIGDIGCMGFTPAVASPQHSEGNSPDSRRFRFPRARPL
jgi:hypothetical protein